VPLEVPLADIAVHEPDHKRLIAFLKAMEFNTLTRRVAEFAEIDAAQIKQVVINLVINAIDATPRGGRVDLELAVQDRIEVPDPDRGTSQLLPGVAIAVRDDGSGVPYEDREKIFEKFTQIQRNVGPGKKGTGLGLAISQKIMTLHEGGISVDGSEGEGSRFTFKLPVYDEEEELLAFVKDHAHFDSVEETDWTVLVLENVSSSLDGVEVLQRTEAMAKRTMRCDDDGVMLIEGSSKLVILLQACPAGANALLERMGNAIVNEFGIDVEFNYKVAPVFKENMNDICRILDEQEFTRLDLKVKLTGVQTQ